MSKEQAGYGDTSSAAFIGNSGSAESVGIAGHYVAECFDAQGNLKWSEKFDNLVTAAGKQAMFDFYFGATGAAGGTASGVNFLGLVGGTATFAAADTMATHTWVEVGLVNAPAYTGNRQSPTWTAASSSGTSPSNVTTKAASAVSFTFTSAGTVQGCFINSGAAASATKDTTVGVLYSAGAFSGGARVVAATDQLNVTYSTTATS